MLYSQNTKDGFYINNPYIDYISTVVGKAIRWFTGRDDRFHSNDGSTLTPIDKQLIKQTVCAKKNQSKTIALKEIEDFTFNTNIIESSDGQILLRMISINFGNEDEYEALKPYAYKYTYANRNFIVVTVDNRYIRSWADEEDKPIKEDTSTEFIKMIGKIIDGSLHIYLKSLNIDVEISDYINNNLVNIQTGISLIDYYGSVFKIFKKCGLYNGVVDKYIYTCTNFYNNDILIDERCHNAVINTLNTVWDKVHPDIDTTPEEYEDMFNAYADTLFSKIEFVDQK